MQNLSIIIFVASLILWAVNSFPRLLGSFQRPLYRVKNFIGIPNTIVHEFWHALVALLTFGKVRGIKIFSNGEGLAVSATGSWVSRTLITFSGYIGASTTSYLFVVLLLGGKVDWIFYIFMAIVVFTLIYIRNFFGFLYVVLLCAGWYATYYYGVPQYKEWFVYYLVTVMLAYSFCSTIDILKLSFKTPLEAGDATSMSKHTKIPALFWGLFFAIQGGYWYLLAFKTIFNL